MSVQVLIIDGPLPAPSSRPVPSGVGAILMFEGVVRASEGEGIIEALEYEAYEPMATSMLTRIATAMVRQHRLTGMVVEHSRGRVAVGGVSFRLTIDSPRRKEGLLAAEEFIDRLKRDVPIWKRPVWSAPPAADGLPG